MPSTCGQMLRKEEAQEAFILATQCCLNTLVTLPFTTLDPTNEALGDGCDDGCGFLYNKTWGHLTPRTTISVIFDCLKYRGLEKLGKFISYFVHQNYFSFDVDLPLLGCQASTMMDKALCLESTMY